MTTPHPEASRETILEAAEKLFVDKGFAGTSMSKIAKEAGVTQSLIHYHFGTKQELWLAVKSDLFARFAQTQLDRFQMDREPSPDLLRESIVGYFAFLKEHPSFIRLTQWNALDSGTGELPCQVEQGGEVVRIGAEKLREAQEAGQLRGDIPPQHIIAAFIGACEHWFVHCHEFIAKSGLEYQGELDDDAFIDSLQKIILEGLLPR